MNPYQQAAAAYDIHSAGMREGDERKLPPIQLGNFPIFDTALAACVAVLEVPLREPGPYVDYVELDEKGNEVRRRKCWWFSDASPGGEHKTDGIVGAWAKREKFEKEHPNHPLNIMRAAIDARKWWIDVIKGNHILPREAPGQRLGFGTTSIREASVLKASGFTPVAFVPRGNQSVFLFAPTNAKFQTADSVLASSHSLEMTQPEQWMRRVLDIQDHMLRIAKSHTVIIAEAFEDNQTLLLTADSERKTRDKFYRQLS